MLSPEKIAAYAASDKLTLRKVLAQILAKVLKDKLEFEVAAEQAGHVQHEREVHETKDEREKEEKKQEAKEKTRAYYEAQSAELEEVEAEIARERRALEIKQKLNRAISDTDFRPQGSAYLIDSFTDATVRNAMAKLIDKSGAARETVDRLLTTGAELHGSSKQLIKSAQSLTYEAEDAGVFSDLAPVFGAIAGRVQELVVDELKQAQTDAYARHIKAPETIAEYLAQDSEIAMTDDEMQKLSEFAKAGDNIDWVQTEENWKTEVADLVVKKRPKDLVKADWVRTTQTPDIQVTVDKMVAPMDKIWGDMERMSATRKNGLTIDELRGFERKILAAEAEAFPRDVPSGSAEWNRKIQALNNYTEEKLNVLAKQLQERLLREAPPVRSGITDPKEFLKEVVLNKGRLGGLFAQNPEMEKLFLDVKHGKRFRDQLFLKIHSAVLNDQRNSSNDNFGLYERADFTTFIDLLRIGFADLPVKETGQALGQAWSDYYNNLSNAIRQSRDLDFWATQPGAKIDDFNKSLAMFQNEYIAQAVGLPAVNAAFRAYELTLRSIMSSNDGYIPPGLIEYSAAGKGSFWDQWSEDALRQMIAMKSVPEIEIDERTGFHVVEKDGHSIKLDEEGRTIDLDEMYDDEIKMYMTLAKGLGLVSARFLEIFANVRVPGSDQPNLALMEQFHSMPYEGVAKSLNFFSQYIHKWHMGSYKFFHLFNQLVPNQKKWILGQNDSKKAIRAYMAYQAKDGSFEKEFGPDAKRLFDLYNFSGISSALGVHTLWRQWDSTIICSDREREFLGGPTQLALSNKYATEAVKRFLVINKFREKYRQAIMDRNKAQPGLNLPVSGSGFDKLWEEYGKHKYGPQIDREWDVLEGKHPMKGKGISHTTASKKTHRLVETYQKAFKTRVWIEMAMRNPLVAAHSLDVDMPLVGAEGEKKMKLHKLLIQDILDIPPEDTKFGAMYGRTGYGLSPTQEQQGYMKEVIRLESDLAAVREVAINEVRDLTEDDFIRIIGKGAKSFDQVPDQLKPRVRQALTYWRKVRLAFLGSESINQAQKIYDDIGLAVSKNNQDYDWDYHKIHRIDKILAKYKDGAKKAELKSQEGGPITVPFLLGQAISGDPDWIYGTDDINFRKMDLLNLGNRHWLRRGGDIAAHEAGGNAVVDYLTKALLPKPDKQKLAEYLHKVVDGYSGDMIEIGWSVAGNLAYMTDRLYTWDWRRMGSAAQKDVWQTHRNVDAWLANNRRDFWDTLEHADVIPPHTHFHHYSHIQPMQSVHELRKVCNADNIDVWWEIIALGLVVAVALTVYRALTTKEEEEGGGGAGH